MRRINITLLLVAIGVSFSVAQIPTDGLVASYPFNGNATDESGNGHDGAVNGAILSEDRFGNANSAYRFDGIDDYVDITNSSLVDGENQLTVSCWIKRGIESGYGLPIHTGNQGRFGFHSYTDSISVNVSTNSTVSGQSFTEFTTPLVYIKQTEWTNVVLWYDSKFLKIYINGQEKRVVPADGVLYTPQTSHLAFGVYMLFNNPNHAYFEGIIDDINIYNRALSEIEIDQLYGGFNISSVNQQDSLALVALYKSTNGDNWANKENWMTGPVRTWFGIGVSFGRVTRIDLRNNKLSGHLPVSIEGLDSLKYLYLSDPPSDDDLNLNQITGSIPEYIGDFLNLQELVLSWNKFSGQIPERIGELPKLKILEIRRNELTGPIPTSIEKLTNLTVLNLSENQLSGQVPTGIFSLSNLVDLMISPNIGLVVGDLPDSFYELKNLETVWLSDCGITGGLKEDLGKLADLQYLYMSSNAIEGQIPKSIENFRRLMDLGLDGNNLSGAIPHEIGKLVNLRHLDLSSNNLTGTIPTELGDINNVNLDGINLSSNNLNGDAPESLNNLTYLKGLWLQGNNLKSIPSYTNLSLEADYWLNGLRFENNQLDFDDIERNLSIQATQFVYAPQQKIGEPSTKEVDENDSHIIDFEVNIEGSQLEYQWFKDGIELASRVFDTLTLNNITIVDAGIYELKVTSSIVPDFELWSNPYTLDVSEVNDIEFVMNEVEALQDNVFSFPILVKGFQNILTAQFTITWDPMVVKYQGVQDFGIVGLEANSFHLLEPGRLTFSWSPDDLQPVSLEDGSTLFNISMKTIGEPGEITEVVFGDDPTVKEVSDGDAQILDGTYTNGRISIMDEVILGGYIKTQKKEPVVGIEVDLIGAMELTTTTDEAGWYEFSVFPNQEYHIAPLFDTEDDDGVTTLDIVVMHWHILGKKYMMSNLDLIASDVNGSGSLTTLDLAETRSVVLHNDGDKFRGKNSVEFINDDYTGDGDVFEYKNYLDIIPTVSHTNLNFTAVKRGDASRSWNPNKNAGGRENLLDEIEIQLEKVSSSDNIEKIALKASEFKEMVGLQFTLDWDPEVYQFKKLSDGQLHFEANLNQVNNGWLTISWITSDLEGKSLTNGDIISTIEFEPIGLGDPNMHITSEVTPAVAYNSDLKPTRISSTFGQDVINEILVYPNPAKEVLTVSGLSEEYTNFSILSITGMELKSGKLGKNVNIKIEQLNNGVYILQLSSNGSGIVSRKFIKE